MIGLHPVTIVFVIIAVVSVVGCVFAAFRRDRGAPLPDVESLIEPAYRNLDFETLLDAKQPK